MSSVAKWSRLALMPVMSACRQQSQKFFSRKYLLATNVGLSVGFSVIGDALQQHIRLIRNFQDDYDHRRTGKMGLAAVSFGFVCHYWYLWLDRFLPGYTVRTVVKKVVLDQIILSPVMWAVYFASLSLIELSGWQKFKERFWSKGGRLYIAEWIVWPPAQVVNFYFLPTRYRVLYDNVISLAFDW